MNTGCSVNGVVLTEDDPERVKYQSMLKFMHQEVVHSSQEIKRKNKEIEFLKNINKKISDDCAEKQKTVDKSMSELKENLKRAVLERDKLGEKLAEELNIWKEKLEIAEEERDYTKENLEKIKRQVNEAREKEHFLDNYKKEKFIEVAKTVEELQAKLCTMKDAKIDLKKKLDEMKDMFKEFKDNVQRINVQIEKKICKDLNKVDFILQENEFELELKEKVDGFGGEVCQDKEKKSMFSKEYILRKLFEMVTCQFCKAVQKDGIMGICMKDHFLCKKCSRQRCLICKDGNTPLFYAPLAPRISDLLQFSCVNLDKGCTVELHRMDLQVHELDCKYAENQKCPEIKCERKVSLANAMDHIESCFDLSNPGPCLTLGVNQNIVFTQNVFFSVFRPVLRLIEGSKDVLVLCSQMFNEKTIIFLRLMTKPKYRYIVEVKIVGNDDTSRSFQGEPIPFGMGIDVAMKNGFTLEFSQETLENITRVQKDPITEYKLHLELTLLKQIKLGRKEIEVK